MQKMGPLESRFADLIWSHEPLPSRELVRLAAEALSWKATTSYTVLKRLCDRGLFQNQGGTVTSLVSRADFYAMQSGVTSGLSGGLQLPEAALGPGN